MELNPYPPEADGFEDEEARRSLLRALAEAPLKEVLIIRPAAIDTN